ncbi:acetyl/propionyl/methylcrotonyl-CoA carboxylase subunit alpha [Gilliamella apicola]|uniref:Biotin carboxylase n=1 Tax=Gilliamella apicola TaxID=1196095 RepID=A0A242NFX6_9GAMM|nr:biotin carboxylase N-terminal domain-containing protein [Gilliamella apicola]OTP81799.1 acetyl/propionyl-CoA carboxylase subunit alpha [Gilliamella apicola]OTP84368.1 acetyl/propionyl-CoA carboxylase subunit alpha [Gilliamella apicola]OTP88508.1 acetyl/propionyl-CoA carboxylase subunit alpha [Gilliamella apicola]OTP98167.1 acetyl/propionyl-CoA carboxylase subunit alpha [Gilliamella apicola]OTQ09550.1 acetyl/propionyl-CoA carboxylase subunit alpha [Gilliamella apicola]
MFENNKKLTHRVLVANRGEIAVRIIRACRDMEFASIAIYADTDINALHVQMADEAYGLSGKLPSETYLNIDKIIAIAKRSGATMVHPGYGFLSERSEFAKAVQKAGLIWIGPNPETIDILGDKVKARQLAIQVGAPLVEGTKEPVRDAKEVVEFAHKHGLPIAIKAAFGGGGRGLKVAWQMDEVEELYHSAVREATAAFGRGECFLEQFLHNPRHIEAQVIADKLGHIVVVGTRDCSLQRRNQKLIEESPAPFISDQLQQQIIQASINICAKANYVGAGTVEFLLSQDGKLSFLEVNTRLQVEHPVTEETVGIDLVVEQLRIAQGLPLSINETPKPRGHAIEFRINAEDVANGFLPTPGTITRFEVPSGPGIRLDSGVVTGSTIPSTFDSLMAKLIIVGNNREQALARAHRALAEFSIEGVASVLPFDLAIIGHPDFCRDFKIHTRWIETEFIPMVDSLPRQVPIKDCTLTYTVIEIDGKRCKVGLPAQLWAGLSSAVNSESALTSLKNEEQSETIVKSPVSGNLFKWIFKEGQEVQESDVIGIMEAMKMEVQIIAHRKGILKLISQEGDFVNSGDKVAEIN